MWHWLESTRKLQSEVYGYNLEGFAKSARPASLEMPDSYYDPGKAALANYLDWNVTAAVQELAEVREEFSWKPWAVDHPFVNRDRVLAECVDVLHFVGNLLTGIGVSDGEFWEAYRAKQKKNIERHESGKYSAKKGGLAMGSDI